MRASRKQWKRYLSLALAMIMLISSITGCGFLDKKNAVTGSDVTQESPKDSAEDKTNDASDKKEPESDIKDANSEYLFDVGDISADWSIFWYVEQKDISTQQKILTDLKDCPGLQILLGGDTNDFWYAFENGVCYEVEHAQGTDLKAYLECFKDRIAADKVIFVFSSDVNRDLSSKNLRQQLSDAFGADEQNPPIDLVVLDTLNKSLSKKPAEFKGLAWYLSYLETKKRVSLDFEDWFTKLSNNPDLSMVEAAYSLEEENGSSPFKIVDVNNPNTIIDNSYVKQTSSASTSKKPSESQSQSTGSTSGADISQQPGDNSTDKPGDDSTDKPDDNSSDKPGDSSTDKPGDSSTDKPEDGTTDKPIIDQKKNYIVSIYYGTEKLKEVEEPEGTVIKDINAPYVDGKIFLGWYYDQNCTKAVGNEDVLTSNLSLYGNYGDAIPLSEGGSSNLLGAEGVEPDFVITLSADTNTATAEDVLNALVLTNISDPSRTDDSDAVVKDELIVSVLGSGKYSVRAKNGYQRGATYQLEIVGNEKVPGLVFEGQTTEVIYYNFTTKKEEVFNLSLDSDVIYLPASALSAEDSNKILNYAGMYEAVTDPTTGEVTYQPTNAEGTFTYAGATYYAGDVIAVYEGTRPDQRTLDSSLEEKVAYILITKAEGNTYSYKSADSADVLFTPDVLPIDIDAGDGVTGWTADGTSFTIDSSKLDFTQGYESVGLDFETVVEPGDFVAFFTGSFETSQISSKGYGEILSVTEGTDTTNITYKTVTYEELLASMDLYHESDLSQEQLDAIDEQMIVASVTEQILESGFAEEAGMYLAQVAVQTDEVKEMLGVDNLEFKDCNITYSDGTPVPKDEIMLMGNPLTGGGGRPEVSVKVTAGLNHFSSGSGLQVEVALKYGFDISAGSGKVHIEMTAIFQTEVMLRFSASGGAEWKYALGFIPYIYDYKMTGNIDNGLYTNIAITATAELQEGDIEGPDDMLEPEEAGSGSSNIQQVVDLSQSIRNMMEEFKQRDAEEGEEGEEKSAIDGLTEKYQNFVEEASDNWVDLVDIAIFSSEGTLDPLWITAYSVNINFVISATMRVAIGMSLQYEKLQRHSFTLSLFHARTSSSNTIDLIPEHYQFDFYVMGHLGVRAGIRAKVLFGVFSVRLAGVGVQVEAGVYAKLWGYFYYCLSWQKGMGKESSATGALYVELGIYLEVKLALEVLNGKFSYMPTLYANEWPIWHAGEEDHGLDFGYGEDGKWKEEIFGRVREFSVPLSYDMVRAKSITVPSEIFRMYYMNLKNGSTGYASYDGDTRGSSNADSSEYDDEERFFVEISEPFSYDPVTNTITVNPEEGIFDYEGTMTITWKQPDITYNSKPLTKTFEVTWIDPDGGYCLVFDTQGGTPIKTQVLSKGKTVKEITEPTKVGYEFGGWYSDEACTEATTVPETMPDHDLTLYAKWIPIPNQYTVYHCYESLSGGYDWDSTVLQEYVYTTDASKTKRVYTDDVLTQERFLEDNQKVKHGFEIDYEKTTDQIKIAPDGSTRVYIYYKRLIHSVTYTMGDLKDEQNKDVVVRYRFEEMIYDPELYIYGYQFKGWSPELALTMDVEDLKYDALWEGDPNTPYYLEYYVKYPGYDQYVMIGGQSGKVYKEGTAGEYVKVSDNLLENVGYRFVKATVKGVETDINGSGKIEPKGKLVIRYYYEAVPFNLSFDPKGGTIVNTPPTEYVCGVPLSIENVIAIRTGYEFLGWFDGEECTEALKSIPIARSGDMTLIAKWEKTTHNISLYDEDGSTKLGVVTATYDEMIPALDAIPVKAGYDFAGYFAADGTCYYDKKGIGQIVWNQLEEITLKAKWTPKKVEINFNSNGGDEDVLSIEGTYLSKYPTLPVPSRVGYQFLGWTPEGSAADQYVTVDTVISDYNTHTLIAQWKPNEDTQYTVECYVQTADSDEVYELRTSYKEVGTTDTLATVGKESCVVPGYTFVPSVEGSILSANINADGSTVLKMYYKKGRYYNVTYHYGDGIPSETVQIADNVSLWLTSDMPENEAHMALKYWTFDGLAYKVGSEYGYIESDMEFTAVLEKDSYVVYYRNIWSNGYEEYFSQKMSCDTSYKALGNLYTKTPEYDESNNITGYYEFCGWNTKYDGTGTTYQPGDDLLNLSIDEETLGEKRVNLYAQWEYKEVPAGMVPYYVNYQIQEGTNYYKNFSVMKWGKAGEATEAEAFTLVDLYLVNDIEQKTIAEYSEETGYTTVEVKYDRYKHKVTLDFAGGTFKDVTGLTAENVIYGDNVAMSFGRSDVSAISNIIPEKLGYAFVGWNIDVPDYMPAYDVTATAQYIRTGLYPVKVEYYLEKPDDGNYILDSYETYYKETGNFTPEPLAVAGFVTPSAQTVTVSENGNTVVKYYYNRQEYTLAWDAGEGTLAEGGYTSGKVKYGAAITAPTLSRTGYTGEWKNFTGTMPAQDITYEPEWTPQKVQYHVMYRYKKSAAETTYSTLFSVRKEALTGSVVSAPAELPEGHEAEKATIANGYKQAITSPEIVAGDGSTIVYVDFNLETKRVFFKFENDVELKHDYQDTSGIYEYGKTIQVPPLPEVTRRGYTPVGWFDIEDPEQTIIGNWLTVEKDATYMLKWEPTEYTITYDLGLAGADNSHNWTKYRYGLDFNISGAVCEHYGFVKWEWAGTGDMPEGVELLENGLVHVTRDVMGDLKFKAVWEENTARFTARLYNSSDALYHVDYPETSDPCIKDITPPQRDGYIFAYWTKKIPSEKSGFYNVRIPDDTKVSTLNYNTDYITAKWLKITQNGSYYGIHVYSEQDIYDAVQIMESNPRYDTLYIERDISIDSTDKPLIDVVKSNWYIFGQEHTLRMYDRTAALINENWGHIYQLKINGSFEHDNREDTYFGALANVNYGDVHTTTLSCVYLYGNAKYVGGLVGCNHGGIYFCNTESSYIAWNNAKYTSDTSVGTVGGIAGYNSLDAKVRNCQVLASTVTSQDYCMYSHNQTLYAGGIVGQNDGVIDLCQVEQCEIGNKEDGFAESNGQMIAGGIAGFDQPYVEVNVFSVIQGGELRRCTVKDSLISSASNAGGLMGECHMSLINANHLENVTVLSDKGYAGQIAGVYDSVLCSDEFNYITKAKVLVNDNDSGWANVIAGGHKSRAYLDTGVPAAVSVRSMDDETKIYNGLTSEKIYRKGEFYSCRSGDNNRAIVKYYDMKTMDHWWH